MLITNHPERPASAEACSAGAYSAGDRRRWRFAPAPTGPRAEMLPAGPASFGPPGPDPVQVALRADQRHAGREAVLGLVLAALVLLALGTGWLWPVLACAFVAAPLVGIGLESHGAWRQWRRDRTPG